MGELYKNEQWCMEFENKEILEHLVVPICKLSNIFIRLFSSDDKELFNDTKEKIQYISFDGAECEFYIRFLNSQTSIFCPFEEFMFIDDNIKKNITSSHTYGNVVYEGSLRDKTHKEMLELFRELIILLVGAKNISVNETFVSQVGFQYPVYNYFVSITNDSGIENNIQIENILFSINEMSI